IIPNAAKKPNPIHHNSGQKRVSSHKQETHTHNRNDATSIDITDPPHPPTAICGRTQHHVAAQRARRATGTVHGSVGTARAQLAAIADRHFGVGADGIIRAVRSRSLPEGAASLEEDESAEWFMDYHNADGSPSEMCGNGIRVYAQYLLENGLIDLDPTDTLSI